MKDIRIAFGFYDHPKTVKLKRRLGADGVEALIRLWIFAAQNKPDGILRGMSEEDIEIASRWNGEADSLVNTLLELRWLDKSEDGIYCLHDWEEHNPYVASAASRSDQARKAANARWQKKYEEENAAGNAEHYADYAEHDAAAYADFQNGNAPSPSPYPYPYPPPSPSPLPYPEPSPVTEFCSEDVPSSPPATGRSPAVVRQLPIRKTKNSQATVYDIAREDVDDWKNSYPAVDVEQELREMRQWLLSNKKRQKTHQGVRGFITHWLGKEQDSGQARGRAPTTATEDPVVVLAKKQARVVLRAIETVGHTSSPRFDDPVTSHVVSNSFGWGKVCQIPTARQGVFVNEFTAAYLSRAREGAECLV